MSARVGQCLCGTVTFSADLTSHSVAACHCDMCRKWTTGPLMTIEHKGPLTFTGSENIAVYKSSDFGERGFCKQCGSSLYWKRSDSSDYWLSVGAFSDVKDLKFGEEFYLDDKPQYYALAGDDRKKAHG